MYREESLKAGLGDENWLRLFELMSMEFAASEGCGYAKDRPSNRSEEIADLNAALDAVQTLDAISHAVSNLERIDLDRFHKPKYCVIEYDHEKRQVSVKYLDGPANIGGALEIGGDVDGVALRRSSVVVELDKIENLKTAFPNYFGDVQLFKSSLSEVVEGRPVKQYSLPPVERVPRPPKEVPDDSWLRFPNRRHRRWKED